MLDDAQTVTDFNATRLGRHATLRLRAEIGAIWPDLSRQRVLGLGHAAPFLTLWRQHAHLCVDAIASGMPAEGLDPAPGRCLVQDDSLPFPDSVFDRVLLVHAIETADATRLLRGVWRAMRDDGRLLVVVPNRTGLWALRDGTPFADGAPCSVGRIERLLARSLFRIEALHGALYTPPIASRLLLRAAPALEAIGRRVSPRLAGILLVEAVKDVHAAMPVARSTRSLVPGLPRRVLVPLGRSPLVGNPADQASIPMPYCSSRSK
jgi:SAM-dependent methyltransferase